jgi:phosphoadenylyl-sulfate reductase (thioredoxin)
LSIDIGVNTLRDLDRLRTASADSLLGWAIERFGDRFGVVTSFQSEGMVVVDMAVRLSPKVRILTIDTGRLPPETYEMIERVRQRYEVDVEVIFPEAAEIEAMVTRFGPNLFYESVPMRTLCCHIRKVRPLERKLETLDAYAVGLRRSQTEARESVERITETESGLKLSPLADWTKERVQDYLRANDVPMHPLYGSGYTSIGCGPCTRATQPGEDERAGRWWWEQGTAKECGLHFTPDGRVERTVDVLIREILEASNA